MDSDTSRDPDPGVWVAYYRDWSAMAVFDREIDALRYAVDKSMDCAWVPFATDLREFVTSRG